MKRKTVKELRAAAKARGIKGYSKLSKEALIRALAAGEPAAADVADARARERTAGDAGRTRSDPRADAAPEAGPAARSGAPSPEARGGAAAAPSAPVPPEPGFASTEQLVEDAKYALRPPGGPTLPVLTDLDEDIERLPELTEPAVVLLPQKPGILHAYWVLPPGETARRGPHALRLCAARGDDVDVREEVPVRAERGTWYFHVPAESTDDGAMLVQLGYYENGRFVSALGRSHARLPSLYASTRTDRRWWIDEAEFTRMYLRAGGFVAPARRFGWAASIGSPAPGIGPGEHFAWPGGVGSPSR